MSRFMGAIFGQQLRGILEHHYGPEQHGFRKGHSTVSLLHILEIIIDEAKAGNTEVVIVQIDVAKAFDKVDRKAVESFAKIIVARSAPEAAKFISEMYKGDKVEINYGKAKRTVTMKSGIRQGDPISPPIFSALLGHILKPLIKKWKRKGFGAPISTKAQPGEKVTVLAYADDITLIAANRAQAEEMLKDLNKALEGINLKLLPGNAVHYGRRNQKDLRVRRSI